LDQPDFAVHFLRLEGTAPGVPTIAIARLPAGLPGPPGLGSTALHIGGGPVSCDQGSWCPVPGIRLRHQATSLLEVDASKMLSTSLAQGAKLHKTYLLNSAGEMYKPFAACTVGSLTIQ